WIDGGPLPARGRRREREYDRWRWLGLRKRVGEHVCRRRRAREAVRCPAATLTSVARPIWRPAAFCSGCLSHSDLGGPIEQFGRPVEPLKTFRQAVEPLENRRRGGCFQYAPEKSVVFVGDLR